MSVNLLMDVQKSKFAYDVIRSFNTAMDKHDIPSVVGSSLISDSKSKLNNTFPIDGEYDKVKINTTKSNKGLAVVLKTISCDEWISGKINKGTINKIRSSINKLELTDKDNAKEYKIKLKRNLQDLIYKYGTKSLIRKFSQRSKKTSVKISSKLSDLIYSDWMNGKPQGIGGIFDEDPKHSINLLHNEDCMAIAYKGNSPKTKTSRAVIMLTRDMKKTTTAKDTINFKNMSVIDLSGPIRQVKHIAEVLVKIAEEKKINLYFSSHARHRLRCLLEFEDAPKKQICKYYDADSGKYTKLGFDAIEMKCMSKKWENKNQIVIPNAYKVIGKLKPK